MARGAAPQTPADTDPAQGVTAPSALGHGLSLRQAQFVTALLDQVLGKEPTPINAAKAAEAIGVPPAEARAWGRLMLEAPPVRAALHEQLRAQIEAGVATPTRWLAEVARIALTEPPSLRDFYHEDGSLRPPHEWTAEMSAQVAEFQSDEIWEGYGEERQFKGWGRKIKLHPRHAPKLAALEMLAKYHKLIVNTLEVTGRDGEPLVPRAGEDADSKARATRERLLASLGFLPAEQSAPALVN